MAREQFELSDKQSALLSRLMEECELPTKKAVVENALIIFGWAVREIKNGRSIAAISEEMKVYRDLLMPALENARERAGLPRKVRSNS